MWQLWFKQLPWAGKSTFFIVSQVSRGARPTTHFDGSIQPPFKEYSELMHKCWLDAAQERPDIGTLINIFESDVVPVLTLNPVLDQVYKADAKNTSIDLLHDGRTRDVAILLKNAGLERYCDAIVDNGFCDLDLLHDKDFLDDVTLADVIGMGKVDIKKFRYATSKLSAGEKHVEPLPPRRSPIPRLKIRMLRHGTPEDTILHQHSNAESSSDAQLGNPLFFGGDSATI